MFGGLEVKAKGKETKEEAAAPAPAAAEAPAPSSAFSFLASSSSSSTPAVATAQAPASSGFSFLQSSSTNATETTAPAPAPAAPAAASSAFDFMTGTAAPAPAPKTDPEASPTATTSSSSFSFLSAPAPATSTTEATNEIPAASGFSFMASTSATATPATAPAAEASKTTAPPAAADLFSAVSSLPSAAGSGVVFGGAMATKPKKKRNRASKIGVGATTTPASPAPTPPRAANTMAPAPAAEDTRTKALEAAQRAEAFLQEKMAQQHKSADSKRDAANNNTAKESDGPPPLQKAPSLDREDEEVAAALEAAKEAQQQMAAAAKPQRSHFGLGGLFRSTGSTSAAPAVTNHRTVSSSSMHSHKSTDSQGKTTSTAGKAEATSSSKSATATEETPSERLQREQGEVKRAMAERELQMRKEATAASPAPTPSATLEIPDYGAAPSEPAPVRLSDTKKTAESPLPAPSATTTTTSIFGETSNAPKLSMNSSNFSFMAPKPPAPVVKKKPVPVHRETPTDVFVAMMRDFSNTVTASMAEIQRLRQHKSGLLEQRFRTVAKHRLAVQQKAVAENQQMAAAEAEDFELADRLNTLIATHEREEKECTAILENIGRALEQLESQKTGLVKRITGHFSDIQTKLHKFQEEQESKETEDVTETLQKFSVVSKQLSAENERLQGELKNLERDAKLVDEERKEVENTIAEQAGVYEKLRDEARAKVQTLEGEIEELRKKLQEKQRVVGQLRTEAAGHEEEILKVRVKFGRQLGRVKQKEMSLQHAKEDWEREKDAFETQREEHEAEVEAHSDALVARDKLLATLKTEVEMADTFEDIVGKEIGFEVTSNDEDTPDEELAGLQAQVVKSEASLSEGKEVLLAAVNHLASLEAETKSLETKITILEETKKAAAAKRDFKAAAKATKDLKEAIARLQECQSEIETSALGRKEAAELECKRLEEELSSKRSVALEKERDAGKATMQRLVDHMKRLLATKESVCANAEEDSIQAVGALVLDAQIKALQFEGKTYGDKYGGWDELIAVLGVGGTENHGSPRDNTEQEAAEAPPRTEDDKGEAVVPPTSSVSPEEKVAAMKEFRELSAKMGELNVSIEEAAASEDFEKAAELDEELNAIAERIESLGLSDDDMAAAFQVSDDPGEAAIEEDEGGAETDAQSADVVTANSAEEEHVDTSQPPADNDSEVEAFSADEEAYGDSSPEGRDESPGVESDAVSTDDVVQENGSGNDIADSDEKEVVANGGDKEPSAMSGEEDDEL